VLLSSGGQDNHITAGLTEANNGTFYSTSFGTHLPFGPQVGSVFKITPVGVKTLLHTFTLDEGFRPFNAPIEASDGHFYGTTLYGGSGSSGSIYRVSPTGSFTTLKVFNRVDGAYPAARLLQASDGAVYGIASLGGPGDCGVIFRITIP
jgi:uncharacterized repeat protein (TIGR03803 family)